MTADTQAHVAFYLTGRRTSDALDAVDGLGLRPALLAGYRELADLRYDFPLVLLDGPAGGPLVQPLSALVDRALVSVSHGHDADRLRQHGLRIERRIRRLVAGGASGRLAMLWDTAVGQLAADAEATFAESARRVHVAMAVDGDVLDCNAAFSGRLLRHAWRDVQAQKATAFRKRVDRLILKLSDILKAEFERSEAGRSAPQLKASMGGAFETAFDFGALSKMLTATPPREALTDTRRRRVTELLAVLKAQRFYAYPDADADGATAPYTLVFDRCADALAAFHERMPQTVALARAMAMAELEVDGQYHETRHDTLFESFGANGLEPEELAAFPDILVCVAASPLAADEHAQLLDILTSGLPIKVLLQLDDILEESPYGEGPLTSGLRSRQVASMAMGLNEVYVLQASASHLYQLHDHLHRGLTYQGPALFSVFSGASGAASGLPPYLVAAAAMESRAFPAFTYDPSAGPHWAARFSLHANTHIALDWPVQHLEYADARHQRVSEDVAFTLVDFVASDPRYSRHLARVPRARWHDRLIPVDQALSNDRKGLPDTVPSLLMADDNAVLHRVIADDRLLREARRCREMWHSLQELGGVHNSHAEQLLARERRAWEARQQHASEAHAEAELLGPVVSATPSAMVAIVATLPAEIAERSPDEAYIESARCSTCNECTTINNRMFAYNANRQAYIADVTAGTYAQLVEAAESCQVSIIHPGKPRNANEPGIDALLKRAAPFR